MTGIVEMMLLGGMAFVALERDGFLTICISFLKFLNVVALEAPVAVEFLAQQLDLGWWSQILV